MNIDFVSWNLKVNLHVPKNDTTRFRNSNFMFQELALIVQCTLTWNEFFIVIFVTEPPTPVKEGFQQEVSDSLVFF